VKSVRAPQSSLPEAALERTNLAIHELGESVRHFFREQKRSAMVSPLFNLPLRLILGSYCYYENLPALLEELVRSATPEGIGEGMKRLCARPNYIHLNSLALGYLNGREQLRLRGQAREDRRETMQVLDFWARVAARYRNDGLWLPDQADFTVPILPADRITELEGLLRSDLPAGLRQRIRRMVATIELYTFILHGEARVGVFHHGPYPLDGGDVLIVKELVGLQEDYYPWARLDARLPYASLARVVRLRNVRTKLVLFGSLTVDAKTYEDRVVAEEILLVEEGRYRPLPHEEIEPITALAADAQLELYRRVLEWDDRYRIEYGADLYGCLLKAFAEPLGRGAEFARAVRERFQDTIARHLDDLCAGSEPPLVLQHIAQTDGAIYAPLRPV